MEKVIIISILTFLLFNLSNSGWTEGLKQEPVKFKTFQYVDKDGIGIEAFRVLIPSDWKLEGGIHWILDNPAMPAITILKIANPKGSEELEVFPNQMFFWTNNQMLLSMFPIGSKYFGSEVHPPTDPIGFIQDILIPRARHNVSNIRLIEKERIPDLAKQLGAGKQQPGITVSADSGKMKIEYQQNGKWFEEVIFAVVESFTFPIQTMYGSVANTNWVGDYLFSFKAEKGKLDASTKTFQTIINSFQVNPQWFNKYSQLVEYLIQAQIKRINAIGQISRIISQMSNEISDINMQAYQNRQATYDRISENFSQTIRGVDSYYDPIEQRPIELPSGYNNAWTNSLGEYILSDNSSFNPNVESNLNWQRMELKK